MKILTIMGTPHKGNTRAVVDLFLEEFKDNKNEFDEVILPKDLDNICLGCQNCILRGEDSVTQRWGTFNPKQYKYNFNTNNLAYANQLKPGDIVHKPNHVAVIIGVDKDTLQVAEMTGPVIITIIRKSNGASINHQNSFTEFVLMDEFFKTYGAN